jgi:hypothetical protein
MENKRGDFRYAIFFEATRRCPPFEQFPQFAFEGHLERLAVFDKLAGEKDFACFQVNGGPTQFWNGTFPPAADVAEQNEIPEAVIRQVPDHRAGS